MQHPAPDRGSSRTPGGSPARPALLDLASDEAGLPAHPELTARLGGAAHLTSVGPAAGGEPVRTAACGWFARRGLHTAPDRVVFGPGIEPLLFAVLAAVEGDVLLTRPCRHVAAGQAALLGRRVHRVPAPAECGGVPDPFALLETVRRARSGGGNPRVLVLTVPDDPTGTVVPPELLHEICEASRDLDLVVVADESRRDLAHHCDTVVVSPAEMLPERTVVLSGLGSSLDLGGWRTGFARFPEGSIGDRLLRDATEIAEHVWAAPAAPVEDAAAYALSEPDPLRAYVEAAARLHAVVAAEACRVVSEAGALCRPPEAGFCLYPDLAPVKARLAERGAGDAASLERRLLEWHAVAVRGGHRFGDDPSALRFRVTTGGFYGATDEERWEALNAPAPLRVPHVAQALSRFAEAFTEPTDG
ncbi:aminotransferase class I/II-fold pyridoxal phosphate-dependent enzyme [Wenjunlia tyrosinilytica]|uniref:Aminopeptidase n=1 Tax=Wenjunlia tyrosinilytica TaxID=1544741 RepID=A0A917ZW53_9ACTN|nr:pyridoxal phosphate-dependent aminotransferase [Wenjunlia tyrosinilytica]GGO94974.1 aminopeptidase [Wenjunlia tyrosinilytica]